MMPNAQQIHASAAGWALGIAITSLFLLAPAAASAFVTTLGCANNSSCTLAELLAGGSIVVETRVFHSWELDFIDPDGVQPDFSVVLVEGMDDGGFQPGPGVRFSGNGELAVSGEARLDVSIGFTVTEFDAGVELVDQSLRILSDVVVGTAVVTVESYIADGNGVALGDNDVETDPAFGPPRASDSIEFPAPQKTLIIDQDIALESSAAGDSAVLETFEQRIAYVPEPSSTLMLLVGTAAMGFRRNRRPDRVGSDSSHPRTRRG